MVNPYAKQVHQMRVAVYTCITRGYDVLKAPLVVQDGVDFLCFNDGSVCVPEPWRGLNVIGSVEGQKTNRFYKLMPHKQEELNEYDVTIYIDGSVQIVGDVRSVVREAVKMASPVCLYDHPKRSCVYDELLAIAAALKAPVSDVVSTARHLRRLGLPERFGLFEGTVIVRRRCEEARVLMDAWWREYESGLHRDQVALMALLWKSGLKIGSLGVPDHRMSQSIFRCAPHTSKTDVWRRNVAWWLVRPAVHSLHRCRLLRL